MPSAGLVDIDELLKPISDEMPVGFDCRNDPSPSSTYQQIKQARNSARSAERNNMFGGSNDEADEHWQTVIQLAPQLLSQQAKDLEVASWYTEAMVRRYGFSGLRDCFKIILGLIENYWDNIYPTPDEDGIETRVAPLSGLNGEGAEGVIIAPIRNCLITEGSSCGPFSYWEYQQAMEAHRLLDESAREDKEKKLGYSLSTVEKAVSESSVDFFVNLKDDLAEALATYKAIGVKLDEYCGAYDAPPTSNIRNILDECYGAVCHLGQDKFPIEAMPEEEQTSAEDGGAPSNATAQQKTVAGPIANREQAFKQILEISEFFRKTEPHSPVSYILEKAVKWGKMPLPELMQELITDDGARQYYSTLTGLKTED